ncbi:hypothetical protein POJ06DRAFT_199884 [Lipomyces tetrasporus]|uniref:Peptidase S54 rhomboid domain-containing protein n=1 Tax=Lipomyces tetrasporus TaxID=54092 RepID=A0AAD7VR05_9ASCO|nr:uncharacterized protein POJ06DRAFT_199884 [Lipomyces tetrasporus]KAJ8098693.1 hypothetical protein POJ06DRAFT_199884 [Lipomyces tetrasporus]
MFAATPPGFKNAPISKLFITITVSASIVSSIVGIKHYFFLQLVPHIWGWGQWWRLIVWEFVYLNESEVLFASLLVYNLRVIERMLGSRKYASMLILSYGFTFLLAPFLLILLKIVPSYTANYLPPGPTPIIFAALALYHDMIPSVYKFRISSSPPPAESDDTQSSSSSSAMSTSTPHTITLSDKIFVYILSAQLALAQMPASLICAFTGWLVGVLWTREVLPGRNWRIPELWWERTRSRGMASLAAFGTGPTPVATGVPVPTAGTGGEGEGGETAPTNAAATQGRGFGSQILDTFRGTF